MFCPRCGAHNLDTNPTCMQCGQLLQVATPPTMQYRATIPEHVPSYLAQAILVTLLCCMPFGIVAIVYASQASGRQSAGDYAGAREASGKAKTWCWVSFGCGLAVGALWLAAVVAGAAL